MGQEKKTKLGEKKYKGKKKEEEEKKKKLEEKERKIKKSEEVQTSTSVGNGHVAMHIIVIH